MTRNNAIELWTMLCSPNGHMAGLTTALGTVAVSHDLPIRLSDSKSVEAEKRRSDVAKWLREWADALEEIATDAKEGK